MKYKGYSLEDYRKDATDIAWWRVKMLRADMGKSTQVLNPFGVMAAIMAGQWTGDAVIDPVYAAKWSSISRKRTTGLLIDWLVKIQLENNLDMTSVLAKKLLLGLIGRSVSNKVLIAKFATAERDASNKSKDFKNLNSIIKKYKRPVRAALKVDKEYRKKIKQEVWEEVNAAVKAEKLGVTKRSKTNNDKEI